MTCNEVTRIGIIQLFVPEYCYRSTIAKFSKSHLLHMGNSYVTNAFVFVLLFNEMISYFVCISWLCGVLAGNRLKWIAHV